MTDPNRRNRLDLFTPIETALLEAIRAIEVAGADVMLTDAQTEVQKAKEIIADWIDCGAPGVSGNWAREPGPFLPLQHDPGFPRPWLSSALTQTVEAIPQVTLVAIEQNNHFNAEEGDVLELRDNLEELAKAEGDFAHEVFRFLFPGRHGSIAERVLRLEKKVNEIMTGLEELRTAVGHIATAVTDISASLSAHPAVNNDPELATLAKQLEGAASTLEGIANPPAPVVTPAPATDPAAGGSPAPADPSAPGSTTTTTTGSSTTTTDPSAPAAA